MRVTLRFTRALGALLLVSGAFAAVLSACGGGYGGGGGGGGGGCGYGMACPPPTVSLTAPSSGATVSGMVTLTATASAASGLTIASVQFLINGSGVGTATTSPYSVMWDSTKVANATYQLEAKATDSNGGTTTTSPINITVKNGTSMGAAMTPTQIFPAPMSAAAGLANLTVKFDSGAMRGNVKLSGLSAMSVSLHEGFAGATGPTVIALAPSREHPGEWEIPADALLTAEQMTALMQGKLYVIATSAAHPRGEIRGQVTPAGVAVTFSPLAVAGEARAAGVAAAGVVAATVDTGGNTLSIHVNSTGVDDAHAAEVASAATAGRLAVLTKDSVDMGHWSTELAPISAAEVAGFRAGKWSVSVATPAYADGALRGGIRAPAD